MAGGHDSIDSGGQIRHIKILTREIHGHRHNLQTAQTVRNGTCQLLQMTAAAIHIQLLKRIILILYV